MTGAEKTARHIVEVERMARLFPVVEVFGPTIQGEGYLAGLPTHFVRLGLCDYRCSWCDSMYAVEPEQVKEHAERLTAETIMERVCALPSAPWVTLSGGNPAMHDLQLLVDLLQNEGYKVTVETQGSIWRSWLADVDHLTISPKPPSSGMATDEHWHRYETFMRQAHQETHEYSVKVVVFNLDDLAWAKSVIQQLPPWVPTFLSAGTDPPVEHESPGYTRRKIADRYGWLCEQVAGDPAFASTRILPQLHVIAWGHQRGV